MITKEGVNNNNETFWKLHVPDEQCQAGLEVAIVATEKGLRIGGELITWSDIETAEMLAT
jgi:hypothetical protein